MILTREQFNTRLQEMFGDSEDEASISFLEDITDTFTDLESRTNAERITQLESELSEQKKKYRDRFFSGEVQNEKPDEYQDDGEKPKKLRFEDLFEEVK